MKPCPYRRDHEYDADSLCKHCYAKAPPPPKPEDTQPMSLPEGFVWPGIPGLSIGPGTKSNP